MSETLTIIVAICMNSFHAINLFESSFDNSRNTLNWFIYGYISNSSLSDIIALGRILSK